MDSVTGWYGRPVAATMILLILMIVSALVLSRISFGGGEKGGSGMLSVIIEHYGIDSFEMERTITIPLEEEIAGVAGISNMRSTSEYGKTRVNCSLKEGYPYSTVYLNLRHGVDRVYEQLPDSVQKPRIVAGNSSRRPVFIVAFHPVGEAYTLEDLRSYIEKEVKPLFQQIDGTGEIEVGGGSIREIHVEMDRGKAAAAAASAGDIAELLQKSMVLLPSGYINSGDEKIAVSMRAKPETIDEIEGLNMSLPGAALLPVSSLAAVRYGFREPDTVSRVGGRRSIVLYIQSNGNRNIAAQGTRYSEIVESLAIDGVETEIIFNRGERIKRSLRQMLFAVLFGMCLVAISLAAAGFNLRRIIVLACFLPLSLVLSSALLAAFSVDYDHYTLAGFALGLGLIIDIGIVLSAHICIDMYSTDSAVKLGSKVREIFRPLLSSTLTTLVVLVPFFFMKETVPGSLQIASSVSVLIVTALCLATLFMPVYLVPGKRRPGPLPDIRIRPRKIRRKFVRCIYRTVTLFAKKRIFLFSAAVLVGAACLAVLSMGKDFTGIWSQDILFGHAEFESGTTLEAVDKGLSMLAGTVGSLPGVELVETIARRGNGAVTIRYDGKQTDKNLLIPAALRIARNIPGCFLYFPEKAEPGERTLEITLSGDDPDLLKSEARNAAALLQKSASVKRVVLHFKKDPPAYIFRVDHEKTTYAGIFPRQIAEALRWEIYGPVAFKWIDAEGERDLRIRGERKSSISRDALSSLGVPSGGDQPIPLLRLGRFVETEESSKIYRENKRRAVYFTVHTVTSNIGEMLAVIWNILDGMELPEGYSFRMDKKIYEFQERFRNLILLLILVTLLVFMVLASQFESFTYPLIIMSLIPVSLAFPLIGLFIIGGRLTVPVLIGLIIMTGVIVNNGILIADSIRHRGYSPNTYGKGTSLRGVHIRNTVSPPKVTVPAVVLAVRKRLESLVLTSATTVIGTVPLFFVSGEGSAFMKTIAFVVLFGMIGAVIVTFTFLPALFCCFRSGKNR